LQSFKHFLGEDSSNSHVYIIDTSSRKILLSDGVESLPGDFNERFHDDEEFWRTLDRALTEGEGSVDLYQFARGHNGLPGGAVGAAAIAGSDLMVLAVGAPDAISVAAAEFGEAVRARFHRTYLSVLGTLAILLLWVSTSLFLVTRRITRSISQMVAQAEAISLGNFDTTLNVRRGDELGELARALDRMRFSLKAALERLRRRR
jgi:HAMP domain-containing protein